jgi:hypothetical protein
MAVRQFSVNTTEPVDCMIDKITEVCDYVNRPGIYVPVEVN